MTSTTPFTGTAPEYVTALHAHNAACETCAPDGLPNTNGGQLCATGRKIRAGLSAARGREAGRTGAYL